MPNGAQIHTYMHSPKAMEDVDLTDIQIKLMFSMPATPRRTSGRDVMTERWEDDEWHR